MALIINFSDAAAIGIHGMVLLARINKPMNAIDLSKRLGKSKHHVGKVMQRLVKMGFLGSQRGPTGGFYLSADISKISMYDIYSAIEGPVALKDCSDDYRICPVKKCIQNNVVNHLSSQFVDYMKNETLRDYL
ncbi:MAG: Rrf2 family transcriptional regulator [Chlorobi bacterium]|nr:Rrf2 family transcriptional regulator [Chlorobiota bacterium]